MRDVSILTDNGVDLDSALEYLGDLSFYDETLEAFLEENTTREELEKKAESRKQEVKNLEEEERKIDELEKTIDKKEQQEQQDNKNIT